MENWEPGIRNEEPANYALRPISCRFPIPGSLFSIFHFFPPHRLLSSRVKSMRGSTNVSARSASRLPVNSSIEPISTEPITK